MSLILASGSPRRRELLGLITNDFTVCVSGAEEHTDPGLSPAETAEAEELGVCLYYGDEALSGYYDCSARLAAARESCDLMLSGHFQDTDQLIQLLKEDRYTLEEITEVTKER